MRPYQAHISNTMAVPMLPSHLTLSSPIAHFPQPLFYNPRQHLTLYRKCIKCQASTISPPNKDIAPSTSHSPPRLAVFVSGGGSNFKAIHTQILNHSINAQVSVVVTNSPSCGGAKYAADHGIPVIKFPKSKPKDSSSSSDVDPTGLSPADLVIALADEHQVDYIILAGYLKLIPSDLVRHYKKAILNIHPGLLPSFGGHGFYGKKVHQAVIDSGARFSGPTVHFVDEEYDTGPIFAQAIVAVDPFDTPESLASRVLKEEHRLYPKCVGALCDGRVTWRSDGIPVFWEAK